MSRQAKSPNGASLRAEAYTIKKQGVDTQKRLTAPHETGLKPNQDDGTELAKPEPAAEEPNRTGRFMIRVFFLTVRT